MSKKKIIIDIDKAILKHNLENKESKMNKNKLCKRLKITYQSIMNYQNGKVPEIIYILKKISKITGVAIDQLIVEQTKSNLQLEKEIREIKVESYDILKNE